jgi:acetolactate synthase-1/2/3 large subunit
MGNQEPQASILKSLRLGAPENAILVADLTQVSYYSRAFWPVYQPRTYLTPSYAGTLGFAYPTALGAKVACPERPVISISGDGGFFYNVQELATAVQYGIHVVAVIFNDNAYGNVARDMDEYWGGRFGTDLFNPDIMKLAAAYGIVGMHANTPTDVGKLVREGVERDCPVLIEVATGRMSRPLIFPLRPKPTKYQH